MIFFFGDEFFFGLVIADLNCPKFHWDQQDTRCNNREMTLIYNNNGIQKAELGRGRIYVNKIDEVDAAKNIEIKDVDSKRQEAWLEFLSSARINNSVKQLESYKRDNPEAIITNIIFKKNYNVSDKESMLYRDSSIKDSKPQLGQQTIHSTLGFGLVDTRIRTPPQDSRSTSIDLMDNNDANYDLVLRKSSFSNKYGQMLSHLSGKTVHRIRSIASYSRRTQKLSTKSSKNFSIAYLLFIFICSMTSRIMIDGSVILLQLEKPKSQHLRQDDSDGTPYSTNRHSTTKFPRLLILKPIEDDEITPKPEEPLGLEEEEIEISDSLEKGEGNEDYHDNIAFDDGESVTNMLEEKILNQEVPILNDNLIDHGNYSPLINSTIIATQNSFSIPAKQVQYLPLLHLLLGRNTNHVTRMKTFLHNKISSPQPTTYIVGAAALGVLAKVYSSEPIHRCCYFWSHVGPIIVHYKFAKWWMKISNKGIARRDYVFDALHTKYSQPSLDVILHLRGLYVKIGQILSSRPDFMPKQYVEKFSELQDSIPQLPLSEIESIVRMSLKKEKGLNYDDVFEFMDPIALGSASIGQVHKAVIRDQWVKAIGTRKQKFVAVKVMHPGAKQRFTYDFQVFRWLCRVTLPGWKGFLDELERQVLTEFDYRDEAASLRDVRGNMAKSPYNSKVCVPEPLEYLCCEKVLVMEYLNGKKLVDVIADQLSQIFGGPQAAAEYMSLKRNEVLTGAATTSNKILESTSYYGKLKLLFLSKKYRDYVYLLVDAHGHQIFVDGCWNGDPHAGNFLQLIDGRIGLVDYGQTKRIGAQDRQSIAKVVTAISDECNSTTIAELMRHAGFKSLYQDDDMMATYAKLFFDSDEESERQGCATPQIFFAKLMATNPLVDIPDAAGKKGHVC